MRVHQHRVSVFTNARGRRVGGPDAHGRESRPCRIAAHVRRRSVRDGERLSFLVVDGNDAAHRPQPVDHSYTFGSLSKTAPIMTNAMRLPPLKLLHPCQLPSCTTTSPAFITTLPRS